MIEMIIVVALAIWGYKKLVDDGHLPPLHGCAHEWIYTGETYGYSSEFKQCKKCGKRKIVSMD